MSRPSKPCKIPFRPILRHRRRSHLLGFVRIGSAPICNHGHFQRRVGRRADRVRPDGRHLPVPRRRPRIAGWVAPIARRRILLRAVAVFLILLTLYCTVMTGAMVVACAQTARRMATHR